jgi:hypothetical protein
MMCLPTGTSDRRSRRSSDISKDAKGCSKELKEFSSKELRS